METSAVLKPQAGWYSSHWSIASASVLTRPFTISSTLRTNEPLAGLQDLYARAAFLLGVTSGLPAERTPSATGAAAPPEPGQETRNKPGEVANRQVRMRFESTQTRINPRLQSLPAAGPVNTSGAPDRAVFATPSQPDVESAAAPETFAAMAKKTEVLIEAVNRLGEGLDAHEFLARDIREYGNALISRFAENLAPYGLSRTGGSLSLDRDRLAGVYEENPQQVAEAFWGPNSLTPDIASLAAAIIGAPGSYLLETAPQTPQTYQPFQDLNPWFRLAPTGFYQVA